MLLWVAFIHLPSVPVINSTLKAPKSPPTAYMETMRDQMIVMVRGGGGSLYLWNQLLLMKLWMYCREKVHFVTWLNNRNAPFYFSLSNTHSATTGNCRWKREWTKSWSISPVMENSIQYCGSHFESFLQFPKQWWGAERSHGSAKQKQSVHRRVWSVSLQRPVCNCVSFLSCYFEILLF